jgi:hypothetical protein
MIPVNTVKHAHICKQGNRSEAAPKKALKAAVDYNSTITAGFVTDAMTEQYQ